MSPASPAARRHARVRRRPAPAASARRRPRPRSRPGWPHAACRVAVVTIDPAQRLATALGLDELGNEPHRIEPERFAGARPGARRRRAVGDDARPEAHVRRADRDARPRRARRASRSSPTASTASCRTRSPARRSSPPSRSCTSWRRRAAGTCSCSTRRRARNALDFLDAPDRLRAFFEGRALQTLLRGGGAGLRLIGRGAGLVLGLLQARDRRRAAERPVGLLPPARRPARRLPRARRAGRGAAARARARRSCSSPRPSASRSTRRSTSGAGCARRGMSLGGAIVNRVHVDELGGRGRRARGPARAARAQGGLSPALAQQVAAVFVDEHALARRDAANVAHLRARLGADVPLLRVPLLDDDVHDVEGLVRLMRRDRCCSPRRRRGCSTDVRSRSAPTAAQAGAHGRRRARRTAAGPRPPTGPIRSRCWRRRRRAACRSWCRSATGAWPPRRSRSSAARRR